MDRDGAESEECERETDGGEGKCREDYAELDFCICATSWKTYAGERRILRVIGKIVSEIDDGEKLLICEDLNGHVGAGVEGFKGVHGGFGKRNVEGEMILEFANALNFVVANTWFKKNEGRLIYHEIHGKCRTVIDYMPDQKV